MSAFARRSIPTRFVRQPPRGGVKVFQVLEDGHVGLGGSDLEAGAGVQEHPRTKIPNQKRNRLAVVTVTRVSEQAGSCEGVGLDHRELPIFCHTRQVCGRWSSA